MHLKKLAMMWVIGWLYFPPAFPALGVFKGRQQNAQPEKNKVFILMATPKLPQKTWSASADHMVGVSRPPERPTSKLTADFAKNTPENTDNALDIAQARNSARFPPKRTQTTETLLPPPPAQDDVQKSRPSVPRPVASASEPRFTSLRGIFRPGDKKTDKLWSSSADVVMDDVSREAPTRQGSSLEKILERQPTMGSITDRVTTETTDRPTSSLPIAEKSILERTTLQQEEISRPPIRVSPNVNLPLLSSFSSQEQEARIVNDLLFIFLGCDGNYIRPHRPEDTERSWTLIQDEEGNAWEVDTSMGTFPS